MKKFICRKNCSLKDFTDEVYPQGSFCFAQLLRAKDIRINGVKTDKNVRLNAGDEVTYYTTPAQESIKSHEVVYEDENMLVADKHAGVSVEGLCAELNTYGDFYAVHRLDRNTAGLIAFAKNKKTEEELLSVFKERVVKKTYIALCKDNFKEDGKTLTAYLKKDERNALVKIYDSPIGGAKKIITEYTVTKRYSGLAEVKVVLHTGRTHQIRAHLAHIGCPILGDNKYGDEALNKKYSLKRQCLIAKELEINNLHLYSKFTLPEI